MSSTSTSSHGRGSPTKVGELLSRAVRLHKNADLKRAENLYRKILRLDPNNLDALNLMGVLSNQNGDSYAAAKFIEKALALRPEAPVLHLNLARTRLEQGRLAEAVAGLKRALELRPDYAEARNVMGIIQRYRGRFDAAIEHFTKAVTLDPNYGEAILNLATALAENGDAANAREHCQRALSLAPNDAEVHEKSANVFRLCGDLPTAIAHYVRALALKPNSTKARQGAIRALTHFVPASYDPQLEKLLLDLFATPDAEHRVIARTTAKLIKLKYNLAQEATKYRGDQAGRGDSDINHHQLPEIFADRLLRSFLEQTVNVDAELEIFLTALRRHLLLSGRKPEAFSTDELQFMSALAQQSFNNGYAFWVDESEAEILNGLESEIPSEINPPDEQAADFKSKLLAFAMYRPLSVLPLRESARRVRLQHWPESLRPLIKRGLLDVLEEEEIKKRIAPLAKIIDRTSLAVQAQYERNPYPRWLSVKRPPRVNVANYLQALFPAFRPPSLLTDAVQILVAGCGTGQQPIRLALALRSVHVLALDLSKSSLAYATRMARQIGVDNIEFFHGDILNLPQLDRTFPLIVCAGVLHHMEDPMEGWTILTDLLCPGGVMKISLYSECARRDVVFAQNETRARELMSAERDIRNFRREVLLGDAQEYASIRTRWPDFYDMNGCRDLLFHAKEHRFTLRQIKKMIEQQPLEFLGFELENQEIRKAYLQEFPGDREMKNLLHWAEFEDRHSDVFIGMYEFWCQKHGLT